MKRLVLFFTLIFIFANITFSQNSDSSEKENIENIEESQAAAEEGVLQNSSETADLQIKEFNITGLKRTKDRYMKNILSGFEGAPANKETLRQIEIMLQAANFFSEVQVSAEPISQDAAAVNIFVKEKWSFLPLPFVAVSDGSFMAGLFVMDMNAFGVHDTFITGGLYSKKMLMGVGAYVKNPHKKGEFGFSGSFSIFKRNQTFTSGHNDTMLEYEAFSAGAGAKLLYKPTDKTAVSFGFDYNFFNPLETDDVLKMNSWSVNAGWDITKSSWNGIFLSSNNISILGALHFSDNENHKIAESIFASAKIQRPVAQKIRLFGIANGFWGNNLYHSQYKSRTEAGVSVLPKDFRTPQFLALSTGAEFCIVKIKFGMLSAYTLYQAALAQDWDKSLYVAHGPEAGLRIYFAKIVLPAISMGGSYNITNNSWQYSFSLGMGF